MIEKIHQKTWDGILYPVETRKDKVVIVMSGSEGGLEHAGKNGNCGICDFCSKNDDSLEMRKYKAGL